MFRKIRSQKKNRITKAVISAAVLAIVLALSGCTNNSDDQASKSLQEEKKGEQGVEDTRQEGKSESDAVSALDDSEVNAKLLEYGQKVLDLMLEKIKSDAYLKVMTSSPGILNSEYVKNLREADYVKPQKVYKVTLKEEFINLIWTGATNDELTLLELSDELQKELRARITGSVITLMNQRVASVESVAVSSMLSTGKSYVANGLAKEPEILVYMYENAYPLVVSITESEEGILGVVSNVLFIDDFKADTEEELRTSLSEAFSGVSQFMAGANIIIEQIQ